MSPSTPALSLVSPNLTPFLSLRSSRAPLVFPLLLFLKTSEGRFNDTKLQFCASESSVFIQKVSNSGESVILQVAVPVVALPLGSAALKAQIISRSGSLHFLVTPPGAPGWIGWGAERREGWREGRKGDLHNFQPT